MNVVEPTIYLLELKNFQAVMICIKQPDEISDKSYNQQEVKTAELVQ
jgi:hypothetical protein